MNSIIYLLQVSACTAVFYLFYYLFLTRLTFFVTNRWYLLVTVVLSFVIPLIKIQVSQPHVYTGVVEHVVYQYTSQPEQVTPVIIHTETAKPRPIHWGTILRYTYIAAVAGLTIHLLFTLLAFFKRLKGKRITRVGKVNILSSNDKIANGSFLNYIFLNDDELSPDEMQQIIAHEMLHVKLCHSVDRILIKIAQIVLWFNPFIYLYARSVEENHEFEVDRAVARQTDKHNYANLLVHLSVAGQGMLYHNFSKVPLKKRITMLFNQPSANMKKIVYVLVVPVVLISCLAFARLKTKDNTASNKKEGSPFTFSRKTAKIPASGTLMDLIRIENPSGRWLFKDVALLPGTKLGFFINHKLYTEEQFKSLPASMLKEISKANKPLTVTGIGTPNTMASVMKSLGCNDDLTGFGSIIVFNVKEIIPIRSSNNFKEKEIVPMKSKISSYSKNEEAGKAYHDDAPTNKDKIAGLFVRNEVKKASGDIIDEVASYSKGASATTEIKHNGKIGFYIDRDFYNEEAFNKVSDKIKLVLANKGEEGVCEGPDFSYLTKRGYTANMKGYDAIFYFAYKMDLMDIFDSHKDTIRKNNVNPKLKALIERNKKIANADPYRNTADYKNKKQLFDDIYKGGQITVTVKERVNEQPSKKIGQGFIIAYNGHNYAITTSYGQEKALNNLLKVGDVIQIRVFGGGWDATHKYVGITPAFVIRDNQKIFQLAEADKIPTTPFLYEPNKVRYADGQVSDIKKYPNDKWKSATFETVNGYKFYLTFKPNAPAMKNIEWGDHVRLRFVHEVSNGNKTFSIADWVSISPDTDGYGIRNPELFDKYYQEQKTVSVSSEKTDKPQMKVTAADSGFFDAKNKITHLYGNVSLTYGDINLQAGHLTIDEKNRKVTASGSVDPKRKDYKEAVVAKNLKEGTKLVADSIILYMDSNKLVAAPKSSSIYRKL